MVIHIAPSELHLRFFNDQSVDVSLPIHAMTEPYNHFCTCSINDQGEGRIEGVTFTFTRQHQKELAAKLPHYGVKRVTWRHHGNEHHINLKEP